jgi:hypothetical protein
MRITIALACTAVAATLAACGRQANVTDVDPRAGLECFAAHRASQPPGTQYEGIERASATRLTIRIMNGVDVVTVDCDLDAAGTVTKAATP